MVGFWGKSPDILFHSSAMAQKTTTGVLGLTTGASTGASDSALHVQLTLSTYATNGRFIFSAAQALHALRRFAADARWVAASCGHDASCSRNASFLSLSMEAEHKLGKEHSAARALSSSQPAELKRKPPPKKSTKRQKEVSTAIDCALTCVC